MKMCYSSLRGEASGRLSAAGFGPERDNIEVLDGGGLNLSDHPYADRKMV